MIGVWNGLRALAGDALVAAGTVISEQRGGFDERQAAGFLAAGGRMESDGPDAADADPVAALTDAELLRVAARIIAGWRPLLLRGEGIDYDIAELDALIAELNARSMRTFAAVIDPDDDPQPRPLLMDAADLFPQHRK